MALGRPDARRSLLALVAVILAVATASLLFSPSVVLGHARALAADPLAFGVLIAALYLVRPALAWPTTPLAVVVGYGYGLVPGLPVALAGVTATAVLPYLAASRYADTWPLDRLGGRGAAAFDVTGDLRGMIAARLAPIPADVVTCAAGASGVPLRTVLVGTAIGEIPWTVAAVLAGASLDRLSASGLSAVDPALVAAAGVVAAVLLAGPVYRHVRTPAGE